ncbi:MAG: bifunctional nuclease domain-containing protein [Pirellulales bacterium]
MRPSDAITLAIICDVPIIVSHEVVAVAVETLQ